MKPIRISQNLPLIEPSFMDAVRDIYARYLEQIRQKAGGDRERRKKLLAYAPAASARALACARGINTERQGVNYDITVRLQTANEYARFYAENAGEFTWLCGETRPITLRGRDANFDVGPYKICFAGLSDGSRHEHFIPLLNPTVLDRHPHHYCYPDADGYPHKNPLLARTSTCFGGFNSVIACAINELDLAGLFHAAYCYVSIYNASSPLRRVGNIVWMQERKAELRACA
jgi:hypothetical protein